MKRRASSSFKAPPRKRQKTVATTVKQLESKLNKISRAVEVKQLYSSQTTAMVPSASGPTWCYLVGMSDMAQGVNDGERIGNEIFVRHIEVTLKITLPSALVEGILFRVLIFCDAHPNGSANLAVTTPYSGGTPPLDPGTLGNQEVSSMLHNWDTRSRYTFYRDVLLECQPAVVLSSAGGVTNNVVERFCYQKFSIPIPNKKVQYNGPGAGNSEVLNNMFQLGVFGTQTGVNPPEISCSTRLIYTDK